jgi:hypothetical protein
MLKVADAAAIIVERVGPHALRQFRGDLENELRLHLGERKYLAEILERHGGRRGLSVADILRLALETARGNGRAM